MRSLAFKNGPTPASFLFIFGLSKQTIQFLQQINVHLVYAIGIQTHDLLNMSRHPYPLDKGSRPRSLAFNISRLY